MNPCVLLSGISCVENLAISNDIIFHSQRSLYLGKTSAAYPILGHTEMIRRPCHSLWSYCLIVSPSFLCYLASPFTILWLSGDFLEVAAAEEGASGVQQREVSRSKSHDLSSPRV